MESWQDQGIVLAVRRHGENGAVVSLLTEHSGRHAGYVRGAQGSKMRGTLEPGNLVDVRWQARTLDDLGTYTLEICESTAAHIMNDPLKLAALQSACALCDQVLPEREGHPGLFHGFRAMCQALQTEVWGQAYIIWEIALLKELGFALDLSRCAGGGDDDDLAYVSPKTGCAVSLEAGEPYKEKLLNLPEFLKPGGGEGSEDIVTGLALTGYFLEHWVFTHHTQGVPIARTVLLERFNTKVHSKG